MVDPEADRTGRNPGRLAILFKTERHVPDAPIFRQRREEGQEESLLTSRLGLYKGKCRPRFFLHV